MIGSDAGLAGAQTSRALMELRDLIASGSIAAEERLTETQLAEMLGMSRTPIRAAVQHLREEGLLEPRPGGGYVARAFGPREIGEAVELRGMIEGLAARLLAERGIDRAVLARLDETVAGIDAAIGAPRFGTDQILAYVRLNAEFHAALAEATESTLIVQEARRANARPFAGASALVRVRENIEATRDHLIVAQDQHKAVLEAIEAREGARAEAIMREHARLSRRNLARALRDRESLAAVPGANLIRRSG
ncbi:MAG: GntR family transcriptional regulator [Rhodovulum sulfidophilum]|uniref:GntR family transcriptional regulator n=1 Tax=Rhodovulum sulfidophilum TaxID=35806 RepID=A0A2W5NB99_RHOSU|nr:MAG: GntR family transcriptional regulator [Rhodovulum sulfidophilum]